MLTHAQIDFEARKSLGRDTNARDHIIEYLEGSTARLGSAPDLYYLHRMDPDTDLQESIGTLAEMRESGKCRFIGLCECSADTLRKACSSGCHYCTKRATRADPVSRQD